MLYDTLASGRAAALARRSSWRSAGCGWKSRPTPSGTRTAQPLGAVLVFEDLTAQKELAAQKREAEQFQLLTRVVARIADEIKNPLVSINTFIELIGERYDDPDFRRHFSSVVRRDVRRLVEVFEKLAGLVTEGELNFSIVDAREVVAAAGRRHRLARRSQPASSYSSRSCRETIAAAHQGRRRSAP